MASGLWSVVLLVLCAVWFPYVSAGDDDCQGYTDTSNVYHHFQKCQIGFCCGTCSYRYCCSSSYLRLSEDAQDRCDSEISFGHTTLPLIFGIVTSIIVLLIFICCCICPCCCLYKICHKPRPVVAATTHTTVVTSTPQHYPRQPTATPGQPLGYQYPPYQATPMQPGYGTQPMPNTSGAYPMPTVPYQGQPFTPGPPPTYQEATGPAYPPNPMPYSQAAFTPGQTPYPIQPPVQSGAPPPHADYLTQPAYNPDYVGNLNEISGVSSPLLTMDVIVRRCPFLARVPQSFFQQSKKLLVVYAQKCPIMMELASKPMAPSMARALCSSSSSSSHQKPEDTMSATEEMNPKLPAGHPVPPSGQAVASKCPFLAAQMGQKNSSVVRQVDMEFQEDVEEVRTVQKEVSRAQLEKPTLATATMGNESEPTNLMKTLLKQRPKRVSHLLQDNLPGRMSRFHYDDFFEKKIDEKKSDHTYRVLRR
ncbi:hypothetical protein Q5P01_001449 [Channa striata]|uniref:Protein shisa-5 n=1 Tax=Channa striata TaxID=64152 RepID=A0AA88T2T7_CHASR|nr:hypothetical protein Q5P01_001449 [Channa striata]